MSEFAAEGEPIEEQVAPEAEATEVEAPEVSAPVEEGPQFDPAELQAENEYLRTQYSELYGMLEQLAAQQPGQSVQQSAAQQGYDISSITDEYGNLDPQRFAEFQDARDQRLMATMQQMFSPIQETFQSQQEQAVIAEGEQRLQDILSDDVARNGEFASDPEADAQARDLVTTLASQLFPDLVPRFGNGPQAAERAMSQAAAQVRGLLRSVGGAAVTQQQNQLANLAGAHGEPGAGIGGVEAPVIRMGETSAARFASGGQSG